MVAAAMVSACGNDGGVDYCQNHDKVHASHLDSIATLAINVSDTGDIEGSLSIPNEAFGGATEADFESLLGDAKNIFALQSERPCDVSIASVVSSADGLDATFGASCGADNKLGKIDVSLFDSVNDLEEVLTTITTSATSKHFEISRQCDSPIFRLD